MNDISRPLRLGTDVVAMLLPHARPLLLVDTIAAFSDAAVPRLRASRHISANEPVFAGHFPRLHLWPGIYTIEGLGQSCYLLYVIREARRRWAAGGGDPADVLHALLNLEAGTRLRPGFDEAVAQRFLEESSALRSHLGVSSAVDIKFVEPVFAGCRLDYEVSLVREFGGHVRYDVLAEVDDSIVAKGTMTAFVGLPNPIASLGL